MGMVKKASAELVTANIAQQEWINSTSGKMSGGRIKTASDNISKTLSYYDPARWLLSHVTIMASVDVELADPKDPTSDYFIKPEHSIFVNNNGDCWERELLAKTYKTFLGANNYCEHVQVPEMSRGKVIDAAIREVDLGVLGSDGKPATTLYVDLLIATSWDFADMCQKIISKEYNSLSMGCFLEGTEITLADGTKRLIEDMIPGNLVITHKGNIRKVNNTQKRYKKEDIYKITVEGDYKPIFVTKEHPFFAINRNVECKCGCGKEIFIKRLDKTNNFSYYPYIPGHHLKFKNPARKEDNNKEILEYPTPSWSKAEDLKIGDFLSYPTDGEEKLDKNATIEFARLLGYFAAEGSYVKETVVKGEESCYAIRCKECGYLYNNLAIHLKNHGITWKQYKEKYPGSEYKAKINKSLIKVPRGSNPPKGLVKSFKNIGLEFSLGEKEYDTLNKEIAKLAKNIWPESTVLRYKDIVKVISEKAARDMQEYCGEYSDRKILSEKVITWPVSIQKHVIAAWHLGDYSCTVSKDLFDQFRVLLNRCGVRFNSYKRIGKEYTCITNDKIYKGKKKDAYIHQLNSIGLNELKEQLEYSFKYKEKEIPAKCPKGAGYAEYKKGYILRKITKIEKIPFEGFVYNLEVDGDNSYIANDVAVHNCFIAYSRCSRCGKIAHDETEQCDHVKYYRHNTFYDDFGNKRIVGEICGSKNDPESVKFIDASWVRKPAFPGAVVRNIVSPPESIKINLSKAITSKGTDSLMEAVRKNEVISTEHHSVDQFLKVASEKIAEDPQTESLDVRFGDEPPKEDTDTSNKTDDSAFPDMGGAGDPSTTTQDPTGADPLPPTDPSSEQQPETSPEEANATPFEDIKKSIEDSVITGVKQILLDKVQKAIAERNVNNDIGEGINNYTSSTRDSEALVKEASSPVNIKYLKDRYSIDISKVPNIITASTLLAMACIKTPSDLSKYGFTRKEAAEAIRYVYARMKGKNVSDEVVDFVCNTKETKGKEANLKFITKYARLMTSEEKEVIQKWPELLKSYNL